MDISVIIPTYNEEKHIERCLQSLLTQDIKKKFEIIIADGGSTDNTKKIITKLQKKHKNITFLHNKEKYQAQGRNLAIKHAKGNYIAYIDGHSYAAKNWLRTLYNTYQELKKDKKIGGVGSIHKDASHTPMSKATTCAMNSFLGGNQISSYSVKKKLRTVPTAYACLFKKDLFKKVGYYDKEFIKGQDLEFNLRVSDNHNLYLQPKAITYYYKRDTFKKLWNQMYRYGYWRWKVMHHRKKYNISLFLPSIALIIKILSILIIPIIWQAGFVIPAYLAIIILASIYISLARHANPIYLIFNYIIIHVGYGLGFLKAIIGGKDKKQDR